MLVVNKTEYDNSRYRDEDLRQPAKQRPLGPTESQTVIALRIRQELKRHAVAFAMGEDVDAGLSWRPRAWSRPWLGPVEPCIWRTMAIR